MAECFLYDAVRTPFGRYGGALAAVRPDDLAAHVVRELVARAPGLDPAQIDDVLFGDANQAGEDNRDVARMAVLLAGLPTSVPGPTINRLCGSSLDAAMQGSRAIETGDAGLVLVGGVESMRRAPWVLLKPEKRLRAGRADAALDDARMADGQPGDARPVDDLARREHREARRHPRDHPRGAGRVRGAQPPARRRRLGRRVLRRLGRPGARARSSSATRRCGPTRRSRSSPR